MTLAFIFPGQGSQSVGMGRDLAAVFKSAALVFEEVDEALGENLSRLMFDGPAETLTLTENAQPALMAVSLAVMGVLQSEGGVDLGAAKSGISYVAGHSLGEYSALAAAGTFSITDVARLLKTRGRAMQRAVAAGDGAMAALLGLDLEAAAAIAEQAAGGDICNAANDNADGQVVISGDRAAVERAMAIARENGARRCVLLPVSAPFHCALMAPAAETMADALAGVRMRPPVVPLVANVTAADVTEAAEIRRLLVEQVTGMVRWRESVLFMKENGVDGLVEIGAGKVLAGLARRIDRGLTARSIGTAGDVEAYLSTL